MKNRQIAGLGLSLVGVAIAGYLVACGSNADTGPGQEGPGLEDASTPDTSTAKPPSGGKDAGASDTGASDAAIAREASAEIDAASIAWLPDPASHVNTLVGTTGGGNVFPGAIVPFGMLQWSPDTSPNRSEGGGYEYTDTQTTGFSLTHISGPGCGAFGDIPILPLTGGLPTGDPGSHAEPLSHTGEVASAGYYSVQTGASPITTELTATLHSSMARFTYPATNAANLLIKLLGSQNGSVGSSATIVGTNEVSGSTTSGFFCGASDKYTLYFDIVFDQPFTASQVITASGGASPSVVFLTFDATTNHVVQAKVSISFVSVANARANWTFENPNPTWAFDTVKGNAHTAWNALLNQVQISGGSTSEQELFYTSIYHSLIHPNVFSDTNGQYMGFDNQPHSVALPQKDQYANYSSWDIYHSQVQLSALIAPQQMSDSAQSMINDAAQNSGMLPKWSLANGESYVMVGDPADGIIAGYYAFGAQTFDTATALKVMVTEATVPNNIRPGLADYMKLGYLPDDASYGCCNFYGSVSTLLEYTEADFALSQFAQALGDTKNAATFLARSQNWQNVYDPATTFFTPKLSDGTFVAGVGMTSGQGMVEGSASQYRWINSFDRQAQLTAMGGAATVSPLLETFFSSLDDLSGNGALMANEFELGSQYWQSATGEPWKTQDVVNRLRTQTFKDAPELIDNNDDLGALSSQLVWSMLGLFPDYPGSPILTLNGPQFPAELIHLGGAPSGPSILITGANASASAPYVQSLQVDGVPSTKQWLDASFVQTGGWLDFVMGGTANTSLGTGASDAPPSYGMESTSAIGFVAKGPFVVAPGATASTTIGAQSTRSDVAQTVSWTATPPAGVGVSLTSGSLSLAAGAQGTQALTITAPATEGRYTVPFALTSSLGITTPGATLAIIVAAPGAFWPYFDNAGISDDGSSGASFDGVGYSYSTQALAAGGAKPGVTLTAGGITYTWPNEASGQLDNIDVSGQTITFSETTAKKTLGLLGSATNAGSAGAQGTVTVTYADSSTQAIPVAFTDWTRGGGSLTPVAGNVTAVTCAYRNAGGNKDTTPAYVFAISAALTSTQLVTSVTLPASSTGGDIHIFDIELQ
jgi:predicted alpha-1,2-mannosidase